METVLEVELRQHNGCQFIYMKLAGRPTRQLLHEYNNQIAEIYSGLTDIQEIDVIADITQLEDVPMDFIGLGKRSPVINPKTRKLLVVGESTFLKALSSMILKLIHWDKVTYAKGMDNALAQLREPLATAKV